MLFNGCSTKRHAPVPPTRMSKGEIEVHSATGLTRGACRTVGTCQLVMLHRGRMNVTASDRILSFTSARRDSRTTVRTVFGLLVCLWAYEGCAAAQAPPKLGPPDKVDQLHEDSDSVLPFIVRGTATGLTAARALAQDTKDVPGNTPLALIDGVAVSLKEQDAEAIAKRDDIAQVWYVNKDLVSEYINVIRGLERLANTATSPMPANLSLGPPAALMPMKGYDQEPMNLATERAARHGIISIFAIGNYYTKDEPNPGVVNPWCRPDWVICVGAASENAKTLFEQSARGVASDTATWPDVVADGIDVLSTWPRNLRKSDAQRRHDETNPRFMKIPAKDRDMYTVMSGTSQATPQVSRAAAQIVYFISQTIAKKASPAGGSPLFSLTIPIDRFDFVNRARPRLTGEITKRTASDVEVTYHLVEPWRLVKQLLRDTAVPMPGFAPQDVGSGFVSPAYVDQQFGAYGRAKIEILPEKVVP